MLRDDPLHIRLLNLLAAIRDLSPFSVMTAEEDELLRDLIVRWHAEEGISVSEIMRSLAGISQATAFRRVIALRDKGMITLRVDMRDKRVKFVEPTQLAKEYAKQLDQALKKLSDSGSPA